MKNLKKEAHVPKWNMWVTMAKVKLFSDKGYDNASVEEITAVAGVAKGSLYYHFAKKEDIFDMMLLEKNFSIEEIQSLIPLSQAEIEELKTNI